MFEFVGNGWVVIIAGIIAKSNNKLISFLSEIILALWVGSAVIVFVAILCCSRKTLLGIKNIISQHNFKL